MTQRLLQTKSLFVFFSLIVVSLFASCGPTPTPVPAIPNGTEVILICKKYCVGDDPIHLRGSTGRSGVIHSVPDNSRATVLESTIDGKLLYYKVQVDSTEGWIEVASYDLTPISDQINSETEDKISWTYQLTGFSGNRWDAWEKFVQPRITELNWAEFKEEVVKYNPQLIEDEYIFLQNKTYLMPEIKE